MRGEVDKLAPQRANHDERGLLVRDRVLDAHAEDVVALLEVVGDHDDRLRLRDAGHVGGHAPRAQTRLKRFLRRPHHGPKGAVGGRAERSAGDEPGEVSLFVRNRSAHEHAHAALAGGLAQCARGLGDRIFERRRRLDDPTLHKVPREPLARLEGVVVVAPAHADLVARELVAGTGAHDHAASLPRPKADAASDRARVTGRRRPRVRLRHPLVRVLHQRRRRADVDAGAAEIAVALGRSTRPRRTRSAGRSHARRA